MNFSSPTSKTAVGFISNIFSVEAGNSYRISMSFLGSKPDASLKFIPRRGSGTFSTIGATFRINVGNKLKEQETIINVAETLSDARIDIEMLQADGPIWIDNIIIQKAKAVPVNPDDSLLFEINTSNLPTNLPLNGCYVDSYNKRYENSVTIQPYSSRLLFRLPSCSKPLAYENENNINAEFEKLVYPNPSESEFILFNQNINSHITIYSMTGVEIADYTHLLNLVLSLDQVCILQK